MPAPLFRRFVPQPSATTALSNVSESSPAPVDAPIATGAEAATPKDKKKKKSGKGDNSVEVVKAPTGLFEDVDMEDVPVETPKSVKQSKKRKSEVIEDQAGQDVDVSKKHKGVLSKFEKAQKLAEARKDHQEAAEESQQPEEELHGKRPAKTN